MCGVEICQKKCQYSCNPLHNRNCEYCKDVNLQNTNTGDDDRGCSKLGSQTSFPIRNFLTENTKREVLSDRQVRYCQLSSPKKQKKQTKKKKITIRSCKRREVENHAKCWTSPKSQNCHCQVLNLCERQTLIVS